MVRLALLKTTKKATSSLTVTETLNTKTPSNHAIRRRFYTAIKVLGDDLLSRARCTLPLALVRFTSEFGMGSGGTTPLWSPSKRVELGAHVGVAAKSVF